MCGYLFVFKVDLQSALYWVKKVDVFVIILYPVLFAVIRELHTVWSNGDISLVLDSDNYLISFWVMQNPIKLDPESEKPCGLRLIPSEVFLKPQSSHLTILTSCENCVGYRFRTIGCRPEVVGFSF